MRNAFMSTLLEIAAENPQVWLLCGDLGFSVLEPFASRFPERYVNVGVAEQNMAGLAAGIAHSGNTVFVYSIANFPTLRCLEQIRNDICYHGADVKIVAVGAGFAYGSQGYTHHALEDVAIMGTLPGMEVYVPCDPAEVTAATRSIAGNRRPCYLRLSRAGEPILHSVAATDGSSAGWLRHGSDIAVLVSGPVAASCLQAAEALATEGLDVGVVSIPRVKPFDEDFLTSVAANARLLVTVEEHILRGGLHAAVSSSLAAQARHPPVLGIGVPEPTGKISTAGSREALLAAAGLSAAAIAQRIRAAAAAVTQRLNDRT